MSFAIPRQRAVVGALLIAIAAGLAFVASTSAGSGPSSTVVVARRTINPGTRLTVSDIETVRVQITDELTLHGFDSIDGLLGASMLAPIDAGELIQRSAVRVLTAGADAGFSFPIDREHALDGDLRPGDTVDVLATFGSGIDAETAVLARSLRVSSISASDASSVSGSSRLTVTAISSNDEQVLDIAHAAQVAELTLIRTTGTPSTTGGRTIVTAPTSGLLGLGARSIGGVNP